VTAVCLACGAAYEQPLDAALHWRDSGHTTWTVPNSWLRTRPWSPVEFWRSILATAGEPLEPLQLQGEPDA
jgi:hypothetical protein